MAKLQELLVIGPFVLPILFVLTLASGRPVWYVNVAFSVLVFLIKNGAPVFLKSFSFFRKFISKFPVAAT